MNMFKSHIIERKEKPCKHCKWVINSMSLLNNLDGLYYRQALALSRYSKFHQLNSFQKQ